MSSSNKSSFGHQNLPHCSGEGNELNHVYKNHDVFSLLDAEFDRIQNSKENRGVASPQNYTNYGFGSSCASASFPMLDDCSLTNEELGLLSTFPLKVSTKPKEEASKFKIHRDPSAETICKCQGECQCSVEDGTAASSNKSKSPPEKRKTTDSKSKPSSSSDVSLLSVGIFSFFHKWTEKKKPELAYLPVLIFFYLCTSLGLIAICLYGRNAEAEKVMDDWVGSTSECGAVDYLFSTGKSC